jgi:hypothetical protein
VRFLACCTDKDNLYYLSSLPYDDKNNPGRIYLHVMSHTGTKFIKKSVEAVFDKDGQVGFLGVTNNVLYFYQKRMDLEKNDMEIEVFAINDKGEQISNFTFMPKIKDYYAPMFYDHNSDGSYSERDNFSMDMEQKYYDRPKLNALGNLSIDFTNKKIYFYGLTVQKEPYFSSLSGSVSDVFMQSYTLEGKKLSSMQVNIEPQLEPNKNFSNKVQGFLRFLHFNVIDSNTFRLQICATTRAATILHINSKKVLGHQTIEDPYSNFTEFYGPHTKLKLNVYGNDHDGNKTYVNYLRKLPLTGSGPIKYSAINFNKRLVLFKYEPTANNVSLNLTLFE